jgi:hypothetical protein
VEAQTRRSRRRVVQVLVFIPASAGTTLIAAVAQIRSIAGVEAVTDPTGAGQPGRSISAAICRRCAVGLVARGWSVDMSGGVLLFRVGAAPPRRPPRPASRGPCAAVKPPGGPDRASARLAAGPPTTSRFIVSDANREAFEHFRTWSMWPVKATILTGPRRSGRRCWRGLSVARVGGTLFDRAERHDEEELVPRLERGAGRASARWS